MENQVMIDHYRRINFSQKYISLFHLKIKLVQENLVVNTVTDIVHTEDNQLKCQLHMSK